MSDDGRDARFLPVESWPREMVRAVALAYRSALAAGRPEREAGAEAVRAYLAAGGDPA